jgi:hypothetical protein
VESYTVVRADIERDREQIIDIWTRNLCSHDGKGHGDRYEWYYLNGPLGPGRVWLLLRQGQVVGTAGLGIRRIWLGGRSMAAGLASDFAVEKAHRTCQPALQLQKALLKEFYDGRLRMMYGLPNAKSAPLFRRLGYEFYPNLQRYVKVLRYAPLLRRRRSALARAAAPISAAADPIIGALRGFSRGVEGYVLRSISPDDPSFDELWERLSVEEPETAIADRSARLLRWRFGECPNVQYRFLGLLNEGRSRLLGYAVCQMGPNNQVAAVDLLGGVRGEKLDTLILLLVQWAWRQQATSLSLEFRGIRELSRVAAIHGFRPRGPSRSLALLAKPSTISADGWYFTLYDEDFN